VSFPKEITFHNYKISAVAYHIDDSFWAGSYIIQKDGEIICVQHCAPWQQSKKSAEASALLLGAQYMDNCLMAIRERLIQDIKQDR